MEIKVLLIERDESSIEEIKTVLQKDSDDFKIEKASSLKEGLKKLEYCAGHDDPIYDIIVLDLCLPNGRGLSVFQEVIKICKRLPIVIVSKYEEEALECVKNGAQDYIIRPTHLFLLPKSIRYSIERFKLDRRYYQLVESTHAAIYEIDFINERFTYVNDKMCAFSGYKRSDLLKMKPSDIFTDESKKVFEDRLEKLAKGEFINNVEEFQIIRKDGKKRCVLTTAEYIIKENVAIGSRVVALDITSKKKIEREINRSLEKRVLKWRFEHEIEAQRDQQIQLLDNIIQQG